MGVQLPVTAVQLAYEPFRAQTANGAPVKFALHVALQRLPVNVALPHENVAFGAAAGLPVQATAQHQDTQATAAW